MTAPRKTTAKAAPKKAVEKKKRSAPAYSLEDEHQATLRCQRAEVARRKAGYTEATEKEVLAARKARKLIREALVAAGLR